MKQINLEKILDKYIGFKIKNEEIKQLNLLAMKEACRQTLELAAENAEVTFEPTRGFHVCSGDGEYIVDKQSILDTINQIE